MADRWKRNPFSMPLIGVLLAAGGFGLHFLGLFWIQVAVPDPEPVPESVPFVVFLSGQEGAIDPSLAEQAALRDPATLFLPTRWNYAADINRVASLQEETELFSSYDARLTLPGVRLPTPQSVGSVPTFEDLIPVDARRDLRGFGRRDQLLPESPPSPEQVDSPIRLVGEAVETFSSRRRVVMLQIGDVEPPSEGLFDPVVTGHQLIYGRLSGVAQLDQSSGFTDWDRHLLDRIDAGQIEPSLEDGYWRITWFPQED